MKSRKSTIGIDWKSIESFATTNKRKLSECGEYAAYGRLGADVERVARVLRRSLGGRLAEDASLPQVTARSGQIVVLIFVQQLQFREKFNLNLKIEFNSFRF